MAKASNIRKEAASMLTRTISSARGGGADAVADIWRNISIHSWLPWRMPNAASARLARPRRT